MEDKLLNYYERELTYFREMGAEFAKSYPKIAGRLHLEADKCDDPHTERLIEAFAFLCGRVHKKIDDDFPEITESLFNIIYPHYTNPVPSMGIVQFQPLKQTISPAGYTVTKNMKLYSKPVDGVPCQFMTCDDVDIWPIEVTEANLAEPELLIKNAQQVINIKLQTFNETSFSEPVWEKFRFFLNAPYQHVFHLYELIFNNVCHIQLKSKNQEGRDEIFHLSPDLIKPVGFEPDEGILPFPGQSFPGYRLLFEYFCFPEKFLFFDLHGLDRFQGKDLSDQLEITLYFDRPAKENLVVDRDTFQLNAAPAVNLFSRISEPIRVEQQKTEYRVVPDLRRQNGTEVFSIDTVSATTGSSAGDVSTFRPFYSIRHHLEAEEEGRKVFWYMQRRPSGRKGDSGTEAYISFADLDFSPVDPEVEIVTVHATCTNRDLPTRLPFGDPKGDFDMESAAPVARIKSLVKPTSTRRTSLGGMLQWKLISHLSLNFLSLVENGEDALKEILKLYDFDNSPATRQQINGIISVSSRHVTKRVGQGFARGLQVNIEFDETKYVGAGLFLFASVLERFLGQYVSVNSFVQLVVKTIQQKEVLRQWAPRSGNTALL